MEPPADVQELLRAVQWSHQTRPAGKEEGVLGQAVRWIGGKESDMSWELSALLTRQWKLRRRISQSQGKTGRMGYTTEHCRQLQRELASVERRIQKLRAGERRTMPILQPSSHPPQSASGSAGWVVAVIFFLILVGLGAYFAIYSSHLVIR